MRIPKLKEGNLITLVFRQLKIQTWEIKGRAEDKILLKSNLIISILAQFPEILTEGISNGTRANKLIVQ